MQYEAEHLHIFLPFTRMLKSTYPCGQMLHITVTDKFFKYCKCQLINKEGREKKHNRSWTTQSVLCRCPLQGLFVCLFKLLGYFKIPPQNF